MDLMVCSAGNADCDTAYHPFFLPIYSKLDIDTAYHYLELRFRSKGLRVLGAVMFIIYQIGRMSIIMYLPSMVLSNLTGINVNILIIVMGVIAIIYSLHGRLEIRTLDGLYSGLRAADWCHLCAYLLIFHIDGGMGSIFGAFQAGKFLGRR